MATMYVKDDAGNSFIPPSQRPDGSWRKPRRVKDGFVPQDEVPLYESKGKKFAKERETVLPPGLDPELWEKMKANQEKMAKKKAQDLNKPSKASSAVNNNSKGANKQNKDSGANKNKQNKSKSGGVAGSNSNPGKLSNNHAVDQTSEPSVPASLLTSSLLIPGITNDDDEWVIVTSKKKKKAKSKEEAVKAGATGPVSKESANVPASAVKISNSVRIIETEKGIKVTNEAGQPLTTDPAKKLRNLRKKLKDIEKLKTIDPKKLEREQKEKIKNEAEVKAMIRQLELSLNISG